MKPLFRSMIDKLRPGRTEDSLGKKPGTKDPLVDTGTDSNNSTIGLVIKKALAIGSLLVTPLLPACFIPAEEPDAGTDGDPPTQPCDEEDGGECTLPNDADPELDGDCGPDSDTADDPEVCQDDCAGMSCRRRPRHNETTFMLEPSEESEHWDRVDVDALINEEPPEDRVVGNELGTFLTEIAHFAVTTRDGPTRPMPITWAEAGDETWQIPLDAEAITFRTCCCGHPGIYFPGPISLIDLPILGHEGLGHFLPNRWEEVGGELGGYEAMVASFLRLAAGGASEADAIAFSRVSGGKAVRLIPGYAITGRCDDFVEDQERTGDPVTADSENIRDLVDWWSAARYFIYARLDRNGWNVEELWEDLQSLRGEDLFRAADEAVVAITYNFIAMQQAGVDVGLTTDLRQFAGMLQEIERRGGPAARRLLEAVLRSSIDRRRGDFAQGLDMICVRQDMEISDVEDCPEEDPICEETGAQEFGYTNENLWCLVQEDPLLVAPFSAQATIYAQMLFSKNAGGHILFDGQEAKALLIYDPAAIFQLGDPVPHVPIM